MATRPDIPCTGGCGALMWRSRSTSLNPMCRPCRKAKAPAACRECARPVSARGLCSTHYSLWWREVDENRVERSCVRCLVPFMARRDNVRAGRGTYCSRTCAGLSGTDVRAGNPAGTATAGRKRPARKSESRKRAERRARAAAKGSSGGNRVWVQGACLVCAAQFAPSPGLASRYCSTACRLVSRSSKWVDYEVRAEIYERDGFRCCLCEVAVLRRWDQHDPRSATLDHIVPRSRGGSDEPSNLRLLCAGCNSLRGDLTFHDDDSVRASRRWS